MVEHGPIVRASWVTNYWKYYSFLAKIVPISNIKQFVKILNLVLYLYEVPSGVPQDGNLSHLISILFVNSIIKWITNAKLLLFINHIKIYTPFSYNSYHILQTKLHNIFTSWVQNLGHQLNTNKICLFLFFFLPSVTPILINVYHWYTSGAYFSF